MTFKRVSCLIVVVVCLLATLPLVPSAVAGFADFGRLVDAGSTTGFVSVEGCDRGALIVNWQCHGTFAYADPGDRAVAAQPAIAYPDITIANGYRHYATGDRVAVSLRLGTHQAYRSGTLVWLSALGLALLLLYQLTAVLMIAVLTLRRARVSVLGPALVLVLTVLADYAAWH